MLYQPKGYLDSFSFKFWAAAVDSFQMINDDISVLISSSVIFYPTVTEPASFPAANFDHSTGTEETRFNAHCSKVESRSCRPSSQLGRQMGYSPPTPPPPTSHKV